MRGAISPRRRKIAWLLLLLLPSLLAAIYYGLFAADQYVSEARFVVRDAADQAADSGLAQAAAQNRAGNAALALRDYLLSRDAMHQVAAHIDLHRVWAGTPRDPFTYLPAGASDEALYRRYQDRVAVVVGGSSGVTTLRLQAFDAADARAIATRLLDLGSQTLVRLSNPGHLVMITLVTPDLPDEPEQPRRLRMILTIFGFNLIFVAMGWLVGAGLREHATKDF